MPLRLTGRTPDSEFGNRGSNPCGAVLMESYSAGKGDLALNQGTTWVRFLPLQLMHRPDDTGSSPSEAVGYGMPVDHALGTVKARLRACSPTARGIRFKPGSVKVRILPGAWDRGVIVALLAVIQADRERNPAIPPFTWSSPSRPDDKSKG